MFLWADVARTLRQRPLCLPFMVLLFGVARYFVEWPNNNATVVTEDQNSHREGVSSSLLVPDSIIPFLLPAPEKHDSVTIYNMDAWVRLRHLLQTSTHITVTPNGGSVTAGGALSQPHSTFTDRFVEHLLRSNLTKGNITIVQRGHGSRNSLHAAMVMDSYWDPTTDILLWEFSMNDPAPDLRNDTADAIEERNQFLFWLEQVARRKPRPPLVVLVYIWNRPFQFDAAHRVIGTAFSNHGGIPSTYDFVVGQVNLASYVDELPLPSLQLASEALVADTFHPTALGHAMLAHLLLDLVMNTSRTKRDILPRDFRDVPIGTYPRERQWLCGTETEEKRWLSQRISNTLPLLAFTNELPKNQVNYPGMLYIRQGPTWRATTALIGKDDPNRVDQLQSFVLPCCASGRRLELGMMYHHQYSSTIVRLQALQLGLFRYNGPVQVWIDQQWSPGQLIPVEDWPCRWNFHGMYHDLHWFKLDNETSVEESIGLCSMDRCCERRTWRGSRRNSCSNLLSLVAY